MAIQWLIIISMSHTTVPYMMQFKESIEINEAWTAPTIKELAVKMGVDH